MLSRVWLFAIPGTVARQAPLSMGFPRQSYWSGVPCPPPGDLPDPGIVIGKGYFWIYTGSASVTLTFILLLLLLSMYMMACLREITCAAHLWRTVRKRNQHIPLPELAIVGDICKDCIVFLSCCLSQSVSQSVSQFSPSVMSDSLQPLTSPQI